MKKEVKLPIISSKKNPNLFTFLLRDDIVNDKSNPDVKNKDMIKLRHPKTGNGAYFLISNNVYEILKFTDDKRSYFIDENVVSNGTLYLVTPVDPLFLILPYLRKAKHCSPLDQILIDEEYPEISLLNTCKGISELYRIADKRGDDSLSAYIYNEEKTLTWLKKKIIPIVNALKVNGIHVSTTSAVSANFVKVDKTENSENFTRYALGILGEYLEQEIFTKLTDSLGLPPDTNKIIAKDSTSDKRKVNDTNDLTENNKKLKLEEEIDEPITSTPTRLAVKVEKKPNAKEMAMTKAAKGTKSISSFFKRKN